MCQLSEQRKKNLKYDVLMAARACAGEESTGKLCY